MDIRSNTVYKNPTQLDITVEVESPTLEEGHLKVDTEEITLQSDVKSTNTKNTKQNHGNPFEVEENNIDNANTIYGFKAYIKANGGNPENIDKNNLRIEKLQDIQKILRTQNNNS